MELVMKKGNVRVYKLDFIINKLEKSNIKELFESDPIKVKPDFELVGNPSDGLTHVAISDSNQHIERLCFPAFQLKNKLTGELSYSWRCDNICGYNTFLIHGGDPDYVWPDAVYVRKLRMLQRKGGK
jgi:hypothetical protein